MAISRAPHGRRVRGRAASSRAKSASGSRVGQGAVPQLLGHRRGDLGQVLVQLGPAAGGGRLGHHPPERGRGEPAGRRRSGPAARARRRGVPPPRRPADRRARAGGPSGGAAARRTGGCRGRRRAGTRKRSRSTCSIRPGTGVGRPSSDGRSPTAPQSASASAGTPPDSMCRRWAVWAGRPCRPSSSIMSPASSGGTSSSSRPARSMPVPEPGPTVATTATRPTSRRRA